MTQESGAGRVRPWKKHGNSGRSEEELSLPGPGLGQRRGGGYLGHPIHSRAVRAPPLGSGTCRAALDVSSLALGPRERERGGGPLWEDPPVGPTGMEPSHGAAGREGGRRGRQPQKTLSGRPGCRPRPPGTYLCVVWAAEPLGAESLPRSPHLASQGSTESGQGRETQGPYSSAGARAGEGQDQRTFLR